MTEDEKVAEIQRLLSELKQASFRESTNRDLAFLCPGIVIGDVRFRELDLLDWTWLQLQQNQCLSGHLKPNDVAALLWRLSPSYLDYDIAGEEAFTVWLHEYIEANDYALFVKGVAEFLERTFQDMQFSGGGKSNGPSTYSANTSIVDLLAKEYGWSPDTIERMPLVKLFQHVECVLRHKLGSVIKFTASDRIKKQLQKVLNEGVSV